MSYYDVGKDAKRKGAMHPKHAQIPADRPTPAARPKVKAEKPFGFTYERRFFRGKWTATRRWFKTERQRDQAFEKEAVSQSKWVNDSLLAYRNLTKVQRS